MSKKIVVLTGSPRRNGNSFAMTEAFIKSAEKKGHSITRIDASFIKVGGCNGCAKCYTHEGKACVIEDDFNKIAPDILEADAVVFTTPLYWYTFPAQLKAVIDKTFAFFVAQKDIAGKQCALIACCEEEDASMMDGLRFSYEHTIALNKWSSVGEVFITGVLNPGDIEKTDGLNKATLLAEAF